MPKYRLTSPDGKSYDVTAPEGSTKEQAFTMLQQQLTNKEATKDMSDPGIVRALDMLNKGIYNAGGWVADKAAELGAPPQVAGGLGYASNIGMNMVPLEGTASGVRGLGKLASGGVRSGAEWLMNSALKPTIEAHKSGDAALAVKTMLDEGYNATRGGVLSMSDNIGKLNQQVKDLIANSTATINKGDVWSRLSGVESRFRNQVNPSADLNAIEDVGNQFLAHPDLAGKTQIPVQLAQDLKSGTQRQLADSYGELSGAATEAQKALARGLREEVGNAVPEVTGLLSKERDLIRTLDVTERRALMDLNKNPAGLSLLASNPVAAAGFMADKSALFKSLFAKLINPGSGVIPATAGRLGAGALLNQGQLDKGALQPESY